MAKADVAFTTSHRRFAGRELVDSFPDPNHYPLRNARKPPKTMTQLVGEEAMAVLAALSTHFQPVALVPGGTALFAVLPQRLLDRLAALGADVETCEPSLSHPEFPPGMSQDTPHETTCAVDGEVDDGEEPERDAGDEPEFDPADDGIADQDALDLWTDEREALALFWARQRDCRVAVDTTVKHLKTLHGRRTADGPTPF